MTDVVAGIIVGVSAVAAALAAVRLKARLEHRAPGSAGPSAGKPTGDSAAREPLWPLLIIGGVIVAAGTWYAARGAIMPSSLALFVVRFGFPLLMIAVGGMLMGLWLGAARDEEGEG